MGRRIGIVGVVVFSLGLSGCCCPRTCFRGWGCGSAPVVAGASPVIAGRAPCNGCGPTGVVANAPPVGMGYPVTSAPPPVVGAVPPSVVGALPPSDPMPTPPAVGDWRPSKPAVSEYPPPAQLPRVGARLMPPEDPRKVPEKKKSQPESAGSDFTADIPQYNLVQENVAAGLTPFPAGFSWLKNNGFRTVLHVRPTGEDDTAAQAVADSRALTYRTLEVSPPTLNRELITRFGKLVNDAELHPLFVYDKTGNLAGALWYLHFRLNENVPEAEALVRATRLGLKKDASNDDNVKLWLAIEQVLQGKVEPKNNLPE